MPPHHEGDRELGGRFMKTGSGKVVSLGRSRRPSKQEIFSFLTDARTLVTRSDTPLFPLMRPKCDSFRITVMFATSDTLVCMDCGSSFKIVEVKPVGGEGGKGEGGPS
jgi:hypothetical protein